ncbi:hypothetical protein Metbo_2156 [Methanobacterium lacus]|uniref:Uncharacterized protein n=1 Tax=Methanobacterium lacus (strain AL-21) TaxID=877455 RepID=F0TCA4_METLA|nr:hypothetical protein [Methanobacterium lacus]ADZ10371.1 hypothetical protein Metbo_2156 [Methanobacterium lacus]
MYQVADFKKLKTLEDKIKEEYDLYSVIVVDKPLQRYSEVVSVPEKLYNITNAVFPNMRVLDHERYVYEDGKHIFYTEPYNPIRIRRINTKMAERFEVELIPLKRSFHDSTTFPYKIVIGKPGSLEIPDISIGWKGLC